MSEIIADFTKQFVFLCYRHLLEMNFHRANMGSVRLFLKGWSRKNECQGLMVALYERQLLHVNLLASFHTVIIYVSLLMWKRAQTVDKNKLFGKMECFGRKLVLQTFYGKYMKKNWQCQASHILAQTKLVSPEKKFSKLVKIKKNMLNLKTSEAVLSQEAEKYKLHLFVTQESFSFAGPINLNYFNSKERRDV